MKEHNDPLNAVYIIDGRRNEVTPQQMLHEAMIWLCGRASDDGRQTAAGDIVDESLDIPPVVRAYDEALFPEYVSVCAGRTGGMQDRTFETLYPESFSRSRIAAALIDTLWLEGEFRLEDLELWIDWKWNDGRTGNMAAFYKSVEAASDYLYNLGVQLRGYLFEDDAPRCVMSCFPALAEAEDTCTDDPDEDNIPDKDWEMDDVEAGDTRVWTVADAPAVDDNDGRDAWMGGDRVCTAHFVAEEDSELLFIPFDSCGFRLGGSMLGECFGGNEGLPPNVADPDYFMDCFEVVREFSEDGVILSARTVCDGGIAVAARKMCKDGIGIDLSIGGLKAAYGERDSVLLLFSEVPGALVQVRSSDLEYIDTQMLLQDIAYYRLGQVRAGGGDVSLLRDGDKGICDILASLLHEASEGED